LATHVEEAKVTGQKGIVQIGVVEIKDTQPVVTIEGSSIYEVVFESYIAYSVRNDSYTVLDSEEELEGSLICIYARSKFLDYIEDKYNC
jgi:hypothetical protein